MVPWMIAVAGYFAVGLALIFVGPAARLRRHEQEKLEPQAHNIPRWKLIAFSYAIALGIIILWPVLIVSAARTEASMNKPVTAMDAIIRLCYGENPPPKSANMQDAARIAYEELLLKAVSASDVLALTKSLFNGPIPYSTHDLAVSVSLHFFKNPEMLMRLREAQLNARLTVLEWAKEGKVVGVIAATFEDVLYNRYRP